LKDFESKPRVTKSSAVSFPMPVFAPVTITTLPSILSVLAQMPPFEYCLQPQEQHEKQRHQTDE